MDGTCVSIHMGDIIPVGVHAEAQGLIGDSLGVVSHWCGCESNQMAVRHQGADRVQADLGQAVVSAVVK